VSSNCRGIRPPDWIVYKRSYPTEALALDAATEVIVGVLAPANDWHFEKPRRSIPLIAAVVRHFIVLASHSDWQSN